MKYLTNYHFEIAKEIIQHKRDKLSPWTRKNLERTSNIKTPISRKAYERLEKIRKEF